MTEMFKIYDALNRTETVASTIDVELSLGELTPMGLLLPEVFGDRAVSGKLRTPARETAHFLSWINEQMRKAYGQGDVLFKLHIGIHGMTDMIRNFERMTPEAKHFTLQFSDKTFVEFERVFTPGSKTMARYTNRRGKVVDLTEVQLYDMFARAAQYSGDRLFVNYADVGWLANWSRASLGGQIFWNPYMSWSTKALAFPTHALTAGPYFKTNNRAVHARQIAQYTKLAMRRFVCAASGFNRLKQTASENDIRNLLQTYPGFVGTSMFHKLGDGAVKDSNLGRFTAVEPSARAWTLMGGLLNALTGSVFTKTDLQEVSVSLSADKQRLNKKGISESERTEIQERIKANELQLAAMTMAHQGRIGTKNWWRNLTEMFGARGGSPLYDIVKGLMQTRDDQGFMSAYAVNKFYDAVLALVFSNATIGRTFKFFLEEKPALDAYTITDETGTLLSRE